MEANQNILVNSCSFAGVKPIMADLPYPEIQVRAKNQTYANLLSADYCGATSEMSAITQYINNENRLSCEKCPLAKTILGIAMAEMMHLQNGGFCCKTAKWQKCDVDAGLSESFRKCQENDTG